MSIFFLLLFLSMPVSHPLLFSFCSSPLVSIYHVEACLTYFMFFFSFPFHFTSWFVYMINQMIKILIVMNLTVYINHITTKLHIYRCFVWPHNHYLYFSFSFMDFFSIIVNGSNCQNIKIKRKFILKHINILIKIACQILISS
jgi:hypothetical protein